MNKTRTTFKDVIVDKTFDNSALNIPMKDAYTSIEILNYVKKFKDSSNNNNALQTFKEGIKKGDKPFLTKNIEKINSLISAKMSGSKIEKIKYSGKNKKAMQEEIFKFIDYCSTKNEYNYILNILINAAISQSNSNESIKAIDRNFGEISNYISSVKEILDNSVHGHTEAKKQIERIIGQWINGEQDGYCFGFAAICCSVCKPKFLSADNGSTFNPLPLFLGSIIPQAPSPRTMAIIKKRYFVFIDFFFCM